MAVAAPPPSAFDHYLVASLASVRSDGRPHVVPLWFAWDGTAFVIYSKPHAVKVQNLRRDPNAMLALGEPGGLYGTAALVEVRAEIDEAVGLLTAFADKYAELMARLGLSRDTFASVYSQPIRLVPMRWLAWGGSGWA
jgi:PPOX class probable F420-dependent enzyme